MNGETAIYKRERPRNQQRMRDGKKLRKITRNQKSEKGRGLERNVFRESKRKKGREKGSKKRRDMKIEIDRD